VQFHFLGIHKSEPDIYIGFSRAYHLKYHLTGVGQIIHTCTHVEVRDLQHAEDTGRRINVDLSLG
jgi:hypothetical protein